jgi:hypothetical protein
MMTSNKRRIVPIVDRKFQIKYTMIIMGVAAVISVVLGYLLFQSYQEMNEMIGIIEIQNRLDADDANRVFLYVVGFLVAEVLILGYVGLLMTHRVCGPIFVLQRHLSTLMSGVYPKVRPLRTGDEFNSCFEVFTSTIQMLRDRDLRELQVLQCVLASGKAKDLPEEELNDLAKLIEERENRTTAD